MFQIKEVVISESKHFSKKKKKKMKLSVPQLGSNCAVVPYSKLICFYSRDINCTDWRKLIFQVGRFLLYSQSV